VWFALKDILGIGNESTDRRVDLELRRQLVEFLEHGYFDRSAMKVSLHVWCVPSWYRRLFPFRFRQTLKWIIEKAPLSDRVRLYLMIRPRLDRVGFEQFEREPPTGLSFRKGHALVGHCILFATPNRIHFADFESAEFRALISDKATWKHDTSFEKWRLSLDQAKILADKYGKVAAIALQNTESGEFIGCLTLSLPPATGISLEGDQELRAVMTKVKRVVEPLLA
jgi:hypothetical protein